MAPKITPQEIRYIRKGVGQGTTLPTMAKRLHRSESSVSKLIGQYCQDVDRPVRSGANWSVAEDKILKDKYPSASWDDLKAALPKRSHQAIRAHAVLLGIVRAGRSEGASALNVDTVRLEGSQKIRPCLTCQERFVSENVGHRMCFRCRRRAGSVVLDYSLAV